MGSVKCCCREERGGSQVRCAQQFGSISQTAQRSTTSFTQTFSPAIPIPKGFSGSSLDCPAKNVPSKASLPPPAVLYCSSNSSLVASDVVWKVVQKSEWTKKDRDNGRMADQDHQDSNRAIRGGRRCQTVDG